VILPYFSKKARNSYYSCKEGKCIVEVAKSAIMMQV
jgi:hypothetical protein